MAFLAPIGLTIPAAHAGAGNNDPNGANNGPLLVAYGAAHETQQLFRYDFHEDSYQVIGVVVDQFGKVCVELGSMAFIPSGPHQGMYGAPTGGASKGYLVKIDPLTAEADRPANRILGSSTEVYGMTAFKEPQAVGGYKWKILATDSNKNLIVIDPETGIGLVKCTLTNRFGGLAMDYTGMQTGVGTVYAAKGKELWSFPYPARITNPALEVKKPTTHGFATTEALEFAFSDAEARIVLPTIPSSWTDNGALLGFCENDALVAYDPATGEAREYVCTMPVKDFESMVFLTKRQDGWGQIPENAHD